MSSPREELGRGVREALAHPLVPMPAKRALQAALALLDQLEARIHQLEKGKTDGKSPEGDR